MPTSRIFNTILLGAACLFLASPALAVPISFQLEQGVENGFGFSGLHDADDDSPMTGDSLGELNGILELDYDGLDTYTFISSTVSLTSPIYSFEITGGELNTDGGGFLDFVLSGAGPFAQSGSILFAGGPPVCCGVDGPNRVSPTELRLWGASEIVPVITTNDIPKRIGMDLGGSPVPEPSAALVFAAGVLVMQGSMRRKRS